MNFIFWLLIILSLIFLWFILAFAFKPIGKMFFKLWENVDDEINDEKINNSETNNEINDEDKEKE